MWVSMGIRTGKKAFDAMNALQSIKNAASCPSDAQFGHVGGESDQKASVELLIAFFRQLACRFLRRFSRGRTHTHTPSLTHSAVLQEELDDLSALPRGVLPLPLGHGKLSSLGELPW